MHNKSAAIVEIVFQATLCLVSAIIFQSRPTVISGICLAVQVLLLYVTWYHIQKGGLLK